MLRKLSREREVTLEVAPNTRKGTNGLMVTHRSERIKETKCPNCGARAEKVHALEGPFFSRKDLADGKLCPLVLVECMVRCSRCGFEKREMRIFIPLIGVEALKEFMDADSSRAVDEIKARTDDVMRVLNTILS